MENVARPSTFTGMPSRLRWKTPASVVGRPSGPARARERGSRDARRSGPAGSAPARRTANPYHCPDTLMPAGSTGTSVQLGCSNCELRALGICSQWADAGRNDRCGAGFDPPVKAIGIDQQIKAIAPGRILFQQSEPVDSVPVVCSGWAAIVAHSSNGRRQILSLALPGELEHVVIKADCIRNGACSWRILPG
jgi:hypothetical protein